MGFSSELLQDPLDGCFFCRPERWRTIFKGQHTQILAGAGPLCPGYSMLAPRAHVHTAADLDERSLWEFLAIFELLKLSLSNQYGPGYTAYEHGRIGSCRALEIGNDLSTFCHHAHRVVIPVSTNCFSQIEPWFNSYCTLDSQHSIRDLAGEEYVYYETGAGISPVSRVGFQDHKGIPSQFMRRILTTALDRGRDWSWAVDPNYEEMIDTATRLKGEFAGITAIEETGFETKFAGTLHGNVSLDGLAYVGKTTIAQFLSQLFHRPMIDTGMIFRYMAFAKLHGLSDPTAAELKQYLLDPSSEIPLRTTAVTVEASSMATDPNRRKVFLELLRQIILDISPCIIVGRDTWRYLSTKDIRFLIEADFETRLKRRFLWEARHEQKLPDMANLSERIRLADENDYMKLPPKGSRDIIKVNNGVRMFSATLNQIVSEIGEIK